MITSQKKFLILLFCLALIVRAFVFISLIQKDKNAWFYPDSEQYHTAALQFVHGKGNINPDGSPQLYRLPGYPLFLAGCYKIFGLDQEASHHADLSGEALAKALWLQIILASLIPILIFLLSLTLFPSQIIIAKLAGLCAALHVGFSLYAGMVATETLSLIALLCFFILFYKRDQGWLHFLFAGLILGIVSLIRPIGHYTLGISIALLLLDPSILFSKRKTLRANGEFLPARLKNSAALTGGWLLVVAPWLIRNFLITGSIFFHTLPGLHFLQYAAANVIMEHDNSAYDTVRPMLLRLWDATVLDQEQTLGRTLNEHERSVIAQKLALGYLKQHPWYTIKTSVIQMIKTCCSLYTAQTLLSDSGTWPGYTRDTTLWTKIKRFLFPAVKHKILIPIIYGEILWMIFMMLGLGFFCISMMYNAVWLITFLRVLPFMLMFVFITLAYGCARLRFPIEPFFIIFSLAGWTWIYDRMRNKKSDF